MPIPHIPIYRFGKTYESLDTVDVCDHRTGKPIFKVSQANSGLISRDLRKVSERFELLSNMSCERIISYCETAGDLFLNASLPLGNDSITQSPDDYIKMLTASSGLPKSLCKSNMLKVAGVLKEMKSVLRGLTRGIKPSLFDNGMETLGEINLCFYPISKILGVILPNNSPGVNSLWLSAIPLKIPVLIRPGKDEPLTSLRLIQSFIAAGLPGEIFGFYPAGHSSVDVILNDCDSAMIFGDQNTIEKYKNKAHINVHGPGYSKIIIGKDEIENWRNYLDIIVKSITNNSGRSCINASSVIVPKFANEIANELAIQLNKIRPLPLDSDKSELAAFVNTQIAESIDMSISSVLTTSCAVDITGKLRDGGSRLVNVAGSTFLLPTVIQCDTIEHPLANKEYMFPYVSVVEVMQDKIIDAIGPSLTTTAITNDKRFINQLLRCKQIERLNIGAIPTTQIEWDQPHEGNLFEFLYKRRAIQINET